MSTSWAGRRVLITGHTGFKGSWLTLWLTKLGAEVAGLSLPTPYDNGINAALAPWDDIDDAVVDVRDAEAVRARITAVQPDVVLHLAAQALVRTSYEDPRFTYETYVMGAVNVLDAVLATPSVRAVVVVTSDKVYRQDGEPRPFREGDPLGGHDPYSASKACMEIVAHEWARRLPDVRTATARAGNVIGGGDRSPDRLLPDLVRSAESGVPARIRYPNATRPWQHVLEPLSGYLALAERLLGDEPFPASVNFGPREQELPVDVVADHFVNAMGAGAWETDGEPQPHEDARLALDASLAHETLGWQPRLSVKEGIEWAAEWYAAQAAGDDLRALTLEQIDRHERLGAG
jgi:CDP-glucose 4,6-dehydratase